MGRAFEGSRSRHSEVGATLLETLLAALILALAVSIAAALLSDAYGHLEHAARRAAEGDAPLVFERLVADVAAAGDGQVAAGSLVLLEHPAGRVQVERRDDTLWRRVTAPDGAVSEGMLLAGVTCFRPVISSGVRPWASLELCVRGVAPGPTSGARRRPSIERRMKAAVALRGGGGEGW